MPSDELARVKRAAGRRRRAEQEYRAALEAAHAAGESFGACAKAAGVSRQAVQQLLERAWLSR